MELRYKNYWHVIGFLLKMYIRIRDIRKSINYCHSVVAFQLLVRKIRRRLALIYRALGDEDQCNTHLRLADQTDAALGLTCGACGNVFGLQPSSLEALPCAHILHSR